MTVFIEDIAVILDSFEIEYRSIRDNMTNNRKSYHEKEIYSDKQLSEKDKIINDLKMKNDSFEKQLEFLEGEKIKSEQLVVLLDDQRNKDEQEIVNLKSELKLSKENFVSLNEYKNKYDEVIIELEGLRHEMDGKEEKHKNEISLIQSSIETSCAKLTTEYEKKIGGQRAELLNRYESKIQNTEEKFRQQIDMIQQNYNKQIKSEKDTLINIYEARISELKSNMKK